MPHLDHLSRYTIIVEGAVDEAIADWCGPLTITTSRTPDGSLVTCLADIVADQAGLVGIIRRLHGLGVVLLCVERCAPTQ
jgi:hypothetical protein